MKIFSLFLLVFLFCLNANADDHYPRNSAIDVQKYVFQIEVNDHDDSLVGKAQIQILCRSAFQQLSLDLKSLNASGKGMEVKDVVLSGQKLPYVHQSDHLRIDLPDVVKAGELLNFEINYQGAPEAGLIIGKNKFGDRVFFADNWPDYGHYWLPAIDHPSDKAAVDFIVIAPAKYEVVANGLRLSQDLIEGNRKRTHWHEEVPIPVKVMVVGIAQFAVEESAMLDEIPVTSWVFPQNKKEGFIDYAVAVKTLDYFRKNVGPYPYKKLANVQSKTRFGGLENANTIFYYEGSVTGKSEQEGLIAHEVAHQWFGNSVTENDWHHVWLSEGFATYFTNLYMEANYGRSVFVKLLQAQRDKIIRFHQKSWRPVVDTDIVNLQAVLSPDTYEKGAWVLHMLRQELGDAVFWKGIRAYYAEYSGANVLTADFQHAMEKASGKNLQNFFDQWIYQAGHPKLVINWDYEVGTQTASLKVTQMQKPAIFQFPLDIVLVGAEGGRVRHQLQIEQESQTFKIPMESKPEGFSFDPDVKLLFEVSIIH